MSKHGSPAFSGCPEGALRILVVALVTGLLGIAGCETTKDITEATKSFTQDVVDTVTFKTEREAEPAAAAPVEPAAVAASGHNRNTHAKSISISYTVSGGIAGRVLQQRAFHTPDFQAQTSQPIDYIVDPAMAPKLVEVLNRHGVFDLASGSAAGADMYTAHLQVMIDGDATVVTLYGPEADPLEPLVTDLRQTVRADYVARLPKAGICAHRGASKTHPENTLAAFREAVRFGVAMIEFDVNRTTDGRLVLMHDLTVDRTTNGKGKITAMDFDQVRALDAGSKKDARFAGEKVPTLEEALAVMPRDIWLNVHLKGDAAIGGQAAEAIERADRQHQAFVAATAEQAQTARSQIPGVLICNMSRQKDTGDYVAGTITAKAQFIQLLSNAQAVTDEQLQQLHAAGVKVNYYHVEEAGELERWIQRGVDFVLTDDAGPMQAAWKAMRTVR